MKLHLRISVLHLPKLFPKSWQLEHAFKINETDFLMPEIACVVAARRQTHGHGGHTHSMAAVQHVNGPMPLNTGLSGDCKLSALPQ
jgi:hypothetical protein